MNAPTFAQITELNYKIYSTRLNKEVNVNVIVEDMKNYNVLFFGEEHNDSVAHFLEFKIFETLHQSFSNHTTLSMEMFDRDVQTVMNEYLQGSIREKNFTKDARAWSNYRDYKPMVEFAKSNKLDVVCANSPTRYTNLAGRKGQQALVTLSKEAKKYFAPLPYDTVLRKINRFNKTRCTHFDRHHKSKIATDHAKRFQFNHGSITLGCNYGLFYIQIPKTTQGQKSLTYQWKISQ